MRFEEFATTVYPFLELQQFHKSYYRLLEAFAEGKVKKLLMLYLKVTLYVKKFKLTVLFY